MKPNNFSNWLQGALDFTLGDISVAQTQQIKDKLDTVNYEDKTAHSEFCAFLKAYFKMTRLTALKQEYVEQIKTKLADAFLEPENTRFKPVNYVSSRPI